MTAVDLFCGAGGLSRGLIQAGVDVILGVDAWEDALEVYRKNVGRPTLRYDLSVVPSDLPAADIISAGTPCQDYSSAGLRVEGARAALTPMVARIALAHRPKYILLENVPRVAKSLAYREAADLLRGLYGLTEISIDAQYHGVPQLRSRLVVIGRLGGRDGEFREAVLAGRSRRPRAVREVLGDPLPFAHFYWHPRFPGQRGVWATDGPGPTITGRPCPQPPSYMPRPGDSTADLTRVRALTLREAAAIQTFPRQWSWDGVSLRSAWQMVGNAVPPTLATHLGRVLLAVDAES